MNFSGYGVHIESLTPDTAELVRQWRNDPRILRQMEYQEIISGEAQQRWFASVQNERYAYFLIRTGGEPVGMIHLSGIDRENHTAEAGLFIGEERFSGTGITLGASLLLLEYAFDALGLQQVFAKVKNDNQAAERYNALLGFEKIGPNNTEFNRWVLQQSAYRQRKPLLETLVG